MVRAGGIAAVVATALLSVSAGESALADDAGAPAALCSGLVPDHDVAVKMLAAGEALRSYVMGHLDGTSDESLASTVDSVQGAARAVRCSEPLLSPKELKTAKAFEVAADKFESDVEAEKQFRTTILMPLCIDTRWITNARACIARERSNPGGVADLRKIHNCGDTIQQLQPKVDQLKPLYQASRHHAFAAWDQVPVCVTHGWGDTTEDGEDE